MAPWLELGKPVFEGGLGGGLHLLQRETLPPAVLCLHSLCRRACASVTLRGPGVRLAQLSPSSLGGMLAPDVSSKPGQARV